MRFLFVDQIAHRTGDEVHGSVHFGVRAPLRYGRFSGSVVAPGAISEAIGQLASWLCLERNQFTARPVFLFADAITVARDVPTGQTVELSAQVSAMDEESFVFSGEARFGGAVVQAIRNCNGYFMPLAELEDPELTRKRFLALTDGGLRQVDDDGDAFSFAQSLATLDQSEDGIICRAQFAPSQPFYRDHFPRFPVTPIVMLNEAIGAAAKRLLAPHREQQLNIRAIHDIKIRSFVKPDEAIDVRIKVEGRDGDKIRTVSELLKGGKRILRGLYDYQLVEQA